MAVLKQCHAPPTAAAVVILCGVSMFAAGCEGGLIDLQDDVYAVHAFLMTGEEAVTVCVSRNDPLLPVGEEPIGGVRVRLEREGEAVTLTEEQPGWYRGVVAGGVRGGEGYVLHVEFPGGAANGDLETLHPPEVLVEGSDRRLVVDGVASLPLELWAPRAAGVHLVLEADRAFTRGSVVDGPTCRFPGNPQLGQPPSPIRPSMDLEVRAPYCSQSGGELGWDSLDVRLRVVVYDNSYQRYAESAFGTGGIYRGDASAGIEGALGVFGSGAQTELPLRIVRGEGSVAGALMAPMSGSSGGEDTLP